jgi:hypothetical protein
MTYSDEEIKENLMGGMEQSNNGGGTKAHFRYTWEMPMPY